MKMDTQICADKFTSKQLQKFRSNPGPKHACFYKLPRFNRLRTWAQNGCFKVYCPRALFPTVG